MDRKLIRPALTSKPSGGGHRRGIVPESTHAEAGYLQHAIESAGPFVVELLGGEVIRGRLEAYDREVLIVAPEAGGTLVLRKERIRTYRAGRPAGDAEPTA